jgi:hypothetical protein
MEPFMQEVLTRRRRGYIRSGRVKVVPIKRTSDWLPENSDSAFMNTGAKVEYVVPRLARSGQLLDPLADLTDDQKEKLAREVGFKDASSLNIMKQGKENYWNNKVVMLDKNGKYLELANPSDFIAYKILEVNLDMIAPTWEERYNKGTYKFALVFEEEESKLQNKQIDIKKEAYMMFGKIDGSIKKLSDVLWIYYLLNKEGKRLPNNPTLDYLRGEVGRLIDEKPGDFLAIVTDPNFETKALIQRAINLGLIQRDGMTFKVFNEESSKNTLDGLIGWLLDDRNNNVRIAMIGKIESFDSNVSSFEKPEPAERKITEEEIVKAKEIEDAKLKYEETIKKQEEIINDLAERTKALEKLLTDKEKKPSPGRKPRGPVKPEE